jgi:hypothetical protein
MGPFSTKVMFLILDNTESLAVFLETANSIPTAKQGCGPSFFKHERFSHRSYTASSFQLYGAIVNKGDVSHS